MKTWNESLFPNRCANPDESEGAESDSSGHESSADGQGNIVAKLLKQMTVSISNKHSSAEEEEARDENPNQIIYATPLPPPPQPRPRLQGSLPSQIPPSRPPVASSHTPAAPLQFDRGIQQLASFDSEPDSEVDSPLTASVLTASITSISVPLPGPSNVAESSNTGPARKTRKGKDSSAAVAQVQIIDTHEDQIMEVAPRRSARPKAVPAVAATKGGKAKGKKRG